MPTSQSSVVTLEVRGDAGPMPAAWELVTLDILREVGRIPRAELILRDGDAALGGFEIGDQAFFAPGAMLRIYARDEEDPAAKAQVFAGRVVRLRAEAGREDSLLCVELKDAAVMLTQTRRSRIFLGLSDDEILRREILRRQIQDPAGLRAGKIDKTPVVHRQSVQYDCTDWDFLLCRAEANGLLVTVTDGALSMTAPELGGTPVATLRWGLDQVYDFELEIDAAPQHAALTASAWNSAKQEPDSVAAAAFKLRQGNLEPAQIAARIDPNEPDPVLLAGVPLDPKELRAWADGRLRRERLGLLRGRLSIPGAPTLKLLDLIEIKRIGERFDGIAPICGLRHRFEQGDFRTDLQLGLSAVPFGAGCDLASPPAAGLLPPIAGLRVGVVAPFQEDPDQRLRVPVRIPGVGAGKALWARLACADAGDGRGVGLRPEPGDEVLLGFLDDDPRDPVILGALHGPAKALPRRIGAPSEKNPRKGLVTRSGITVLLDDEAPALTIELPSGKTLVLDDQADQIKIADQHGNSLVMGKDGIAIKSGGKLAIDAQGQVTVKGASVDIQ